MNSTHLVLTVNILLNALYILLNSPFANDKLLRFPVTYRKFVCKKRMFHYTN